MKIYTIRRPGCVLYAQAWSKWRALKLLRVANSVCCPGHRIYADVQGVAVDVTETLLGGAR